MLSHLRPFAVALAPVIFVLSLSATVSIASEIRPEQVARSVTIYRDRYGVSHVHGPTDASCVFGFAYAQA